MNEEEINTGYGFIGNISMSIILDMLEEEKGHFTTPVFLGMNGHDISVGFPKESEVIKDANTSYNCGCSDGDCLSNRIQI